MKFTKTVIEEIAVLYQSNNDTELASFFATLIQTNINTINTVNEDNSLTIEITTTELLKKKLHTENKIYIALDNVHKSDIYLIKVIKAAKKDRVRRLFIEGSISNTCYYILEKFLRNNDSIREIRILNKSDENGDLSNPYQLRFIQAAILATNLVILDIGGIVMHDIPQFGTTLARFERQLEDMASTQIKKRLSLYPMMIKYSKVVNNLDFERNERFLLSIFNQKFIGSKQNALTKRKFNTLTQIDNIHFGHYDGNYLVMAIEEGDLLVVAYILSYISIIELTPINDLLTPLQDAISIGHLDMLKLLFTRRELLYTFTTADQQSFFKKAIEFNKIDAVRLLLDYGFIPDDGSLDYAITRKCYEIAIVLINGGAKITKVPDSLDTHTPKAKELEQLFKYITLFFESISTHNDMSTVVINFQETCITEKYCDKYVLFNWRQIGSGRSALGMAAELKKYDTLVELANLQFTELVEEEELLRRAYDTVEYKLSFSKIDCIPNLVSTLTKKPRHYSYRPIIDSLVSSEDFSPILKASVRLDDFYKHLDTAIQDPHVKRFSQETEPLVASDQDNHVIQFDDTSIKSSLMYELAKAVYKMLDAKHKIDVTMQRKALEVIRVVKKTNGLHPDIAEAVDYYSNNDKALIIELVSRVAHQLVCSKDTLLIPELLINFYRSSFLIKCTEEFEEAKSITTFITSGEMYMNMLAKKSLEDKAAMKWQHFKSSVRHNPVPGLVSLAGFAGVIFFGKRQLQSEGETMTPELIAPATCLAVGLYSLYHQYSSK